MDDQADPGSAVASAESPEAAARRRGVWTDLRGGIAQYVRFTARHRAIGCLLGIVFLLAVCGLVTFAARQFLGPSTTDETLDYEPVNEIGTVVKRNEVEVDNYLAGMREFDAQKMWSAYDSQLQSQLSSRGGSVAELQSRLDAAKANGAEIVDTKQLGNYQLRDGRRYVFYIVRRSGFPPDGVAEDLYFVFTVAPSGKILNVA